MTPHEFAYWLQGFAELNAAPPTKEQWKSIQEHLSLVFQKVTPPVVDLGEYQRVFDRPKTFEPLSTKTQFIC